MFAALTSYSLKRMRCERRRANPSPALLEAAAWLMDGSPPAAAPSPAPPSAAPASPAPPSAAACARDPVCAWPAARDPASQPDPSTPPLV
eukprot:CAMPEP_0181170450 /NCGR_PEP_ID=MMETSP1096-20121128/1373_1 /TAXON_ID=156174 ORGANISM="Chrysochromulina ericina, Strain CCMP281" /NCGR_SAMPLE_ID=MMETSP1096 /ASSEMBLY_ACC=CAM_ASM_000453 /LENGTH=89 /DNA_ID=CAMNT_0023258013 /DNA_START=149 /DNA_END=415 /DNA_ORIENTATION=+